MNLNGELKTREKGGLVQRKEKPLNQVEKLGQFILNFFSVSKPCLCDVWELN